MSKKFIALLFCIIISSFYSVAKADGKFTWFGLKNDNTEIVFSSSSENNCSMHNCHHKEPKHKHKHKPKHEHHKKGPKHHKFFWWCN